MSEATLSEATLFKPVDCLSANRIRQLLSRHGPEDCRTDVSTDINTDVVQRAAVAAGDVTAPCAQQGGAVVSRCGVPAMAIKRAQPIRGWDGIKAFAYDRSIRCSLLIDRCAN